MMAEIPGVNGVRPLFRSLSIAASGLTAQRTRMDVIASNIANAETTSTTEGGPYRRKTVSFAAVEQSMPMRTEASGPVGPFQYEGAGVQVTGIAESSDGGQLVYDPGHPDADDKGYVRMPDVSITNEMVDMVDARRSYEANATVFQALKAMLKRATEI
jgi:flagellar basal-body rod protein FlgC